MRLIKMLGLAAVAAIAAMAFLGASSAMATFHTTFCKEKTETLTCPKEKQYELISMLAGVTKLLASVELLCLHSVAKVVAEKNAKEELVTLSELEGGKILPLRVKFEELKFTECGKVSTGSHSDCTVTVPKQPLLQVLKTAVDLGTAQFNPEAPGEINIKCGSFINCTYSETTKPLTVESAEHTEGAGRGMLTAEKLEVAKGKGFLCPATAEWDALYEPLAGEPFWIRS